MLLVEEVMNISILDLLGISEEYELRDLITNVPELTIDSQDENGEIHLFTGSLRFDPERVWFYFWSGCRLA